MPVNYTFRNAHRTRSVVRLKGVPSCSEVLRQIRRAIVNLKSWDKMRHTLAESVTKLVVRSKRTEMNSTDRHVHGGHVDGGKLSL